jgi:hypothetical protein
MKCGGIVYYTEEYIDKALPIYKEFTGTEQQKVLINHTLSRLNIPQEERYRLRTIVIEELTRDTIAVKISYKPRDRYDLISPYFYWLTEGAEYPAICLEHPGIQMTNRSSSL